MASERDMFGLIGPSYLTDIDWSTLHHRRSIAASLVKGVYILEQDRKEKRQGPQALAPQWWQQFNFKLVQLLIDDHDLSYFGAIYEFNVTFPCLDYTKQRPPQYVIAFRGTITRQGNMAQDLKLDLHCIINNLRDSRRFKIGFEFTQNLISQVGPGNVWLAGHSLGSSIALLIGRHMVQYTGTHLETYLFNPPFISAPIEMIKNEKVKFGLRFAKSVMKAGVAKAATKYGSGHSKAQENNDPFIVLSSWIPYLFINQSDLFCSEYFGYFEHREKMEKIGAGKIEKLAAKHSVGNFVSSAMGIDSEATHLIPSANLSINCSSSDEAHGINQWWKLDLEFKNKMYEYKGHIRRCNICYIFYCIFQE